MISLRDLRVLRGESRGFTLVEALVALAVTAVVSVAIIGALMSMTSHLSAYRDDTQLELLMRALASDILLKGPTDRTSGSFDTHQDYQWRITVTPLDDGHGGISKLQEIVMTVTAPDGRSLTNRMVYR